MVPFMHSSLDTKIVKIKNISCKFPVDGPSPEKNVTS